MAPPRPAEPLVVVLGSTGTGKSDLAVELATRFNGEIINADAVQMYHGLPVTTNKISVEEQRGVPHHLLGTISLREPTWRVDHFKREASRIIREIRSRGRLPIIVGGTQYYIDGLLFDNVLIKGREALDGDGDADGDGDEHGDEPLGDTTESERIKEFPILGESTERMYAELQRIDPVMAMRWHPRDRRRILRSLEIYLQTGRRTSDIYAEQKARKNNTDASKAWETLFLWVYAQPNTINERLDGRVDTMVQRGLEREINEMYDLLAENEAKGTPIDTSKGIWQSIGYKEMEPYTKAVRSGGADRATIDRLRTAGLDGIKFGTRRYARSQLRWIRHKTIPYLQDVGPKALEHLYLLDCTDKAAYCDNVLALGADLTARFLGASDEPLPAPSCVSERARTVLAENINASRNTVFNPEKPFKQECAVCRITAVSEEQWQKHVKGARHRKAVQKHKRRALVPIEVQERLAAERAARLAERGLPPDAGQSWPARPQPGPSYPKPS